MKRGITDANPPGIDPARDVIATTLEHLLIAEISMMQPNELEDFPQTMRVFRQIAEEVGFAGMEWLHHLTRLKLSHGGYESKCRHDESRDRRTVPRWRQRLVTRAITEVLQNHLHARSHSGHTQM